MARKIKDKNLLEEIIKKEKELHQVLAQYRINLTFRLEPYSKKSDTLHSIHEKNIIKTESFFFKNETRFLPPEKKENLVTFYKQDLLHGGKNSEKNMVVIPKELAIFLKDLLPSYTTDNYVPVLFKKQSLITDDYSYLQEWYIDKKRVQKEFLDEVISNKKFFNYIIKNIRSEEVENLKQGLLPYSLRFLRIDTKKPYSKDNLIIVKREFSKDVIKSIVYGDEGFIEKLKKDKMFFDRPYLIKPPRSDLLLKFTATFNPKLLEEIGISEEQAKAIAFKKNENTSSSKFNEKYQNSDVEIKPQKSSSSTLEFIDKEVARVLVQRMLQDSRYIKKIKIIEDLTPDEALRVECEYQKIIPHFLRMCAKSKYEAPKLKKMGLTGMEIAMMKYGYRFSKVYECGNRSNKKASVNYNLNIHHTTPRSYGRYVLDFTNSPEGEKVYSPPDRISNLVLMHSIIHEAVHEEYAKQKGSYKTIIDFSKLGNVFDHVTLMKEYGISLEKNNKIKKEPFYHPSWLITKTSREKD